MFLTRLLIAALQIYSLVLIVRIVFTWLPAQHRTNDFYRFIHSATEPVLKPFRGIIPPIKGIDFSPILLFILLEVLIGILRRG